MKLIVKRKVIIFLIISLTNLSFVPIINIFTSSKRDTIEWAKQPFLYNMDFVSKWLGLFFYKFGISIDPNQVVIGLDDWLFLGDRYADTLTTDRRHLTKEDLSIGQEIGYAANAWSEYLSSKGVKLFKVMIGPNKSSIYPEYLPSWAKPSTPNATDALFAGTGTIHYVNLKDALLAAKTRYSTPLYYKTDTHWNQLGAGIAFQAFAQQVGPSAPEIHWPPNDAYQLIDVIPYTQGDLANFLRLRSFLPDKEAIIRASRLITKTTHLDFDTAQIIYHGGNNPVVMPNKPLLVRSEGALNNVKVLWLRDSFGTVMAPLMSATFSEVLQLSWEEAIKPEGRIVQLVEQWQPDYVFLTVVERSSRHTFFTTYPPGRF